jgi:hypothetical protein
MHMGYGEQVGEQQVGEPVWLHLMQVVLASVDGRQSV